MIYMVYEVIHDTTNIISNLWIRCLVIASRHFQYCPKTWIKMTCELCSKSVMFYFTTDFPNVSVHMKASSVCENLTCIISWLISDQRIRRMEEIGTARNCYQKPAFEVSPARPGQVCRSRLWIRRYVTFILTIYTNSCRVCPTYHERSLNRFYLCRDHARLQSRECPTGYNGERKTHSLRS